MKKKGLLFMGLASTVLLAGCGGSGSSVSREDAIKGFKTSVEGTIKFDFVSDYKVDVESEKGGLDSFKQDLDEKVTGEIDLTASNLYLHIKKTGKDLYKNEGKEYASEALVAKGETGYFYLTNTMENPTTLASESEAQAKIAELLVKYSSNKAGHVNLNTFIYKDNGVYEHEQFGLSTRNMDAADYLNADNTITQNGDLFTFGTSSEYIGYTTDGGVSDFPGVDGANGGTYEITTTKDGYVTKYLETMDAKLAMPIMNPAPIVSIKGTKTFTASYGDTLTKLTTIDHEKTLGTVEFNTLTTAKLEVFTAPTFDMKDAKALNSGDSVVVGEYIGLKVTPYGTNTIERVTNNTVSLDKANSGEYFVFEVQEGKNKVGANIKGSDGMQYATLDIKAPENVTVKASSFKLAGQTPSDFAPIENNQAPIGSDMWVGLAVTAPEGKEVEVKGEGFNVMFIAGQYCFSVKEEKTYTVTITLKETEPVQSATLVKATETQGLKLFYGSCAMGDFQNIKEVTNDELTVGNILAIKVLEGDASLVTIKVNDKTCMQGKPMGGFYCFTIVEGTNTVTVTLN